MRPDRWAVGGMLTVVTSLIVGAVNAVVATPEASATLWIALSMGAMGAALAAQASSLAVIVAAFLTVLEMRDPSPWGTWAVAGGLLFLFPLRRPRFDAVVAGVVVAGSAVSAMYVPWPGGGSGGAFGLVALAAAMVEGASGCRPSDAT